MQTYRFGDMEIDMDENGFQAARLYRHGGFGNQNAAGPRRKKIDTAEIIGQAVHELMTDINHRLAHPIGLDEDCQVLGRVIAARLPKGQP